MGYFKNRMSVRRAAAIAALAFFFEAAVFTSSHWGAVGTMIGGTEKGTFALIHDVLREERTGLGARQEFRVAQAIHGESIAHRIDPLFILALIETESTYYNFSRSVNGALGLMQILPSTGRVLASELKLRWDGEETLLDPNVNVKIGVHYFSILRELYNEDMESSLAAYNVGPTEVSQRLRRGHGGGAGDFVKKVLDNYREIKERAEYY